MEITVVTLVKEQMSSWKGNLPKLPIIIKYSAIGIRKYRYTNGTGSLPSGRVDLTDDEDPTDKDGDIEMGDSTRVLVSLGGGISSGGKKSWESNIGDSDNTGDGGTIVGGGIVTCGGLMASYACMTFI
ncbi:hypothetical protein Tco_1345063 [Tanacetum coccineum]